MSYQVIINDRTIYDRVSPREGEKKLQCQKCKCEKGKLYSLRGNSAPLADRKVCADCLVSGLEVEQ